MPGPFHYQNGYGATSAPACQIQLSWNGQTHTISALIDSGASGTLIPRSAAQVLNLRQIGERRASGAFGPANMTQIYRVNLDFLGIAFPNHVVATPGPPGDRAYALIGRDILNLYQTLLNGPGLQFTVQ